MQSADELLCVLNITAQTLHLLCQPHQAFSLLNVLCLDLQGPRCCESSCLLYTCASYCAHDASTA